MADKLKVRLSAACQDKIRAHAVETYPRECCGALLGKDESGVETAEQSREILEVMPLENRREDSPRNRFEVSARDVIDVERTADRRGLQVVGWYHSHPDHPAKPSQYDRERAWPWYSYIIVSVRKRVATEMKSWRLLDDRGDYAEEEIEVVKE